MKKILLILTLLITNSSFAWEHGLSARELNEICKISDYACAAYMAGFLDGIYHGQNLYITKRVTAGTMVDVFKKEMSNIPQRGDEYAGATISLLLLEDDVAQYGSNK